MKKRQAAEHTIPAVEKTVAVLTAIAGAKNGKTHAELAKVCSVAPSTCYRILQSLLKCGWIEKLPGGMFVPGAGFLPVAMNLTSFGGTRWRSAPEILDRLAEKTGLSCKLSIRRGAEQVAAARSEAPGPFSISGKTGAAFPVAEGSVGAALLADSPRSELEFLLATCPDDIPETRDPGLLFESAAFAHEHGYVLNTDRNRWRIGALSVPVRDPSGRIAAALTLLGLPDDFTKRRLPSLLRALSGAAAEFFPEQQKTSR